MSEFQKIKDLWNTHLKRESKIEDENYLNEHPIPAEEGKYLIEIETNHKDGKSIFFTRNGICHHENGQAVIHFDKNNIPYNKLYCLYGKILEDNNK